MSATPIRDRIQAKCDYAKVAGNLKAIKLANEALAAVAVADLMRDEFYGNRPVMKKMTEALLLASRAEVAAQQQGYLTNSKLRGTL